jgi:hypothetical protein
VLHEETRGDAIVTTGVGQHQMWAAQYYKFDAPRRWATSGGLGSMGFGLPSALGAAIAFDGTDGARPKKVRRGLAAHACVMWLCPLMLWLCLLRPWKPCTPVLWRMQDVCIGQNSSGMSG